MSSLLEFCKSGICLPISNTLFNEIHRKKATNEVIHFHAFSTRESSPDQIQEYLRNCLSSEEYEFPGPMCCPFRKCDLHYVKSIEYTIMEKSDGLRVLVIACEAETFPVWRQVETNKLITNRFSVTAMLEDACARKGSGSSELTIDGIHFELSAQQDAPIFTLKSSNEVLTCCRTLEPRLLLYGMDRSSSVYLFDATYPSSRVSWFVGDSEFLHFPEINRSACLAFFDMYGVLEKGKESSSVQKTSTTKRHTDLMNLVESISASHEDCIISSENFAVKLYAKELFYAKDLPKLIQRIHYDVNIKKYFLNGPYGKTLNDGLVFTPEHFECKGGAQPSQLKWKWSNSLTVDWKIHATEEEGMYNVFLYAKKKCFPFKNDIEGHWRMWKPMKLANPRNLEIPRDPEKAVVVESKFNSEKKIWSILHIRQDKTVANSISTIISVFQSIAEEFTLHSLVSALCSPLDSTTEEYIRKLNEPEEGSMNSKAEEKIENVESTPDRTFAMFTLRAKSDAGQHKLHLTWCTNKTNPSQQRIIHVPLCEVKECSAIGFPYPENGSNNLLHHLLMIKVANAGGTYAWSDYVVEAFFDKHIGRWVISRLKPDGKNYMCSFDNVLQHLHYAIVSPKTNSNYKKLPLELPSVGGTQTLLTNAHYGSKVEALQRVTRASYREFNNLIKAHQIKWASTIARECFEKEKVDVVDLCCGRGGDLTKWAQIPLGFVFMTDASLECVSEAAARYSTVKGMSIKCKDKKGFKARFAVHDAFDTKAKTLLKELQLLGTKGQHFHVASCQFSIHYSCGSRDYLDYFLSCVSASLAPGGIFIGTTISDEAIVNIFKTHGTEYSSDGIQIHFPPASVHALKKSIDDLNILEFGIEYFITVEDSVSNLPEYIVPWQQLCQMCERHSLMLISCTSFAEYAVDNEEELILVAKNGSFLSRKRDSRGNLLLSRVIESDKLLKTTNTLYVAFAFKKKG